LEKHLSITVLTCSALLALTNSVNADNYKAGDVLYCEVESGAFVDTPDFEFTKWKPFKFKFKIESNKTIKFGAGNYFDGAKHDIDYFVDDIVASSNFYQIFNLNDGRFNFSTTSGFGAGMLTGICDKF
jgi:hypothetical protein